MATEAKGASADVMQAQALVLHHVFSINGIMSLKCAIELGIPEMIHKHGGPITLSQLASALPVHPSKIDSLRRLMRLLVHFGYFAEQDGPSEGERTYLLTPMSGLLVEGARGSMSPMLTGILTPIVFSALNTLSEWFKADEPSTPFHMAHGKSFWDYAVEDPAFNRGFNEAMASESGQLMGVIIGECGSVFQGLRSLVDVGGGTGTIAGAIAEAFPGLKCTVLDLPHVVADAPANPKVNFIEGDMFEFIPPADAIFLKLILHDWSDDDCVKILKRCKEAIPSKEEGGKVIIVDAIVNAKKSDDKLMIQAQLFLDISVMTSLGGKEREEREWHKIFIDAGFSDYKIKPVPGLKSLIELYP